MNWQFSNDAPIYAQLIGQIRAGIVSGAFSPGERLPSCEIWLWRRASTPTPCSGP